MKRIVYFFCDNWLPIVIGGVIVFIFLLPLTLPVFISFVDRVVMAVTAALN